MVDLPGFGYAKVTLAEKTKWQKLIKDFLFRSDHIALAFHLIDSRHKPTELDLMLNSLLREINISYFVILNKIDKLKRSQWNQSRKRVREAFPELIDGENMLIYSSLKKFGKNEIQKILIKLFLSG